MGDKDGDNQAQGQQSGHDHHQGDSNDDWSIAFDQFMHNEDSNPDQNHHGRYNGLATGNQFLHYQHSAHPALQHPPGYAFPPTNTYYQQQLLQPVVPINSLGTNFSTTPLPAPQVDPSPNPTSISNNSLAVAAAASSPSPSMGTCSIDVKGENEDGKGVRDKAACERKRNREKQRRNDVNQQFTDLTELLRQIEESEEHEVEGECDDKGSKKQRLGKGFYGRSGPTNRIDLIARTIVVLNHLWTENKEQANEVKKLKKELKEARDQCAKAKSDAATSSAQNKPETKEQPMMMMVPMMMPTNSSVTGGQPAPISMHNPMQAFISQMAQHQGYMPFPFAPPFMHMSNNMTHPVMQPMQQTQQVQHPQAPIPPNVNYSSQVPPNSNSNQVTANNNSASVDSAVNSGIENSNANTHTSNSEEAKQSGDESSGQNSSSNNLAHCA